MTPGGQLHMIAKFLSLPSVRRIDANTLYLLHAQIQPSANPCNTKERHSGSSVDDLPFLDCDAYEYSGDGQVASFISSTKHLRTAHYADLEEIAAAESDMSFLSTWILGGCKYCSGIK